jgi:hypothetical protein
MSNGFPFPPQPRRMAISRLFECEACGGLHPWPSSGDCQGCGARCATVAEYAQRYGVRLSDVRIASVGERWREAA